MQKIGKHSPELNAEQYLGIQYVCILDLPPNEQKKFRAWLGDRLQPTIPDIGQRGFNCAYVHDYYEWAGIKLTQDTEQNYS